MPLPNNAVVDLQLGDPQCAAGIRDGLARIEELISGELADAHDVLGEPAPDDVEPAGARLRPLYTMLAAQFGPAPDAWQVTVVGAATELMHLATLRHDEVVDDAPSDSGVRLRAASAHTHRANNTAILAGDYRFAAASRLAARLGQQGFQVIAEAFSELVTGKMRQTIGVAPGADPIGHHLRCVQEKSGSLLAAAGLLGATHSGANEQERIALSQLGYAVGTVAELCADLGDIAGSVRLGVHTLPVLCALGEPGAQAGRLRRILATLAAPTAAHHEAHVHDAVALVRSSPGIKKATDVVAGYAAQAAREIAMLPDCVGRQMFSMLLDGLMAN